MTTSSFWAEQVEYQAFQQAFGELGEASMRDKWTRKRAAQFAKDDIQRLCLADVGALLAMGEGSATGCSDLARARQKIDAYNRWLADLLRQIDQLPYDHLKRRAALAKVRAVRPQVMQAMDEMHRLKIKYALGLHDTPTDDMARA